MATVRVVAFDLMDTVVRDPFRDAIRAATGRPVEEVLADRDPAAWVGFERGEMDEGEYFDAFRGVRVDVDAFHRARRGGYRFVAGMEELLDDLAGQVTRVAASNYPRWVDELADGLLAGRFEAVIASCDVGVRKPDRAFYDLLCDAVGADPGGVLFVDNLEENVAGAREAGLPAHHFVGADDLRARLRGAGLEV